MKDEFGVTVSKLVPSASISAISCARLDCEMPSTATMVAMPSATPAADSTARAGRASRPSAATAPTSRDLSRERGSEP